MLNVALARRRREELGLTQEQLAEQLGIGQGALSNWEAGKREPRSSFLRAWARALQLEPGELLSEPETDQVGVGEADAPPVPSRSGAGNFPGAPATPPQSDQSDRRAS